MQAPVRDTRLPSVAELPARAGHGWQLGNHRILFLRFPEEQFRTNQNTEELMTSCLQLVGGEAQTALCSTSLRS